MARAHILGNSNAYGFGLEDGSWPSLIKADTNRRRANGDHPRITTVHLASPGNLLHHILESGLLEASVNCNRRGNQIGAIYVGACEASILRSQGQTKPRRTKTDFRQDLEQLSQTVEKLNVGQPPETTLSLILMGVSPMDVVKSLNSKEGDDFNNERLCEYDAIIKEYAETTGIQYVDLQTGFDQTTMLMDDGIHLSEAGDIYVYQKMMPAILGKLSTQTTVSQAHGL